VGGLYEHSQHIEGDAPVKIERNSSANCRAFRPTSQDDEEVDDMSLHDAGAAQSMVVGASVENLHAGWFAFWLKTGKSRVRRALQCVLTMCGIPVCWSARDSQKQQGKPKAARISSAGRRRVPTKMVRGIAVARRREPFWEGGQQNRWRDVRFYEGHGTAQRSTAENTAKPLRISSWRCAAF
jgi:hypothetical protein